MFIKLMTGCLVIGFGPAFCLASMGEAADETEESCCEDVPLCEVCPIGCKIFDPNALECDKHCGSKGTCCIGSLMKMASAMPLKGRARTLRSKIPILTGTGASAWAWVIKSPMINGTFFSIIPMFRRGERGQRTVVRCSRPWKLLMVLLQGIMRPRQNSIGMPT